MSSCTPVAWSFLNGSPLPKKNWCWLIARLCMTLVQAPLVMDFPGKNTGVGCHSPLQGISPTQRSNLYLLHLLHWRVDSLLLVPLEKPPVRNCFWFIRLQIFTSKRGVPCLGSMQASLQTLSYCHWCKESTINISILGISLQFFVPTILLLGSEWLL